jgi:endonuclease YncB( thermonuclease family)
MNARTFGAAAGRSLLACFALLASVTAYGEVIAGTVVGISDGDTVTLLADRHVQVKIRLAGIDAPEKRQAFGDRSKTNLSRMVFQRNIDADCGKSDRYHRRICVLYVDGTDVSFEQVRQGMAWHYKQYQREQTPKQREDYAVAEFNAQTQRIGLWSGKNPVPPWEFRHPERRGIER